MKTLSIATAALTLAVAANLAPAVAQGPKPSDNNTWPVSTLALQMPSQQPCAPGTNTVTTTMGRGGATGFSSGNSNLIQKDFDGPPELARTGGPTEPFNHGPKPSQLPPPLLAGPMAS
jgi:hypothetical protein